MAAKRPGHDMLADQYGLVPSRILQSGPWPLLLHMFMHGNLLHILGNMYFLWVFGDNVEDRLGPAALHVPVLRGRLRCRALSRRAHQPPRHPRRRSLRRRGGIMAAYVVLFPQARVVSMIMFFSVRWKTSTYLLVWLGYQVIGASLGIPGIAWWAHIGGFIVGYLVARPYRLGIAEPKAANEVAWPRTARPLRRPSEQLASDGVVLSPPKPGPLAQPRHPRLFPRCERPLLDVDGHNALALWVDHACCCRRCKRG